MEISDINITEGQWQAARRHFGEVVGLYQSLAEQPGLNTSFALAHIFLPMLMRYDEGERTQNLYDEMVGAE